MAYPTAAVGDVALVTFNGNLLGQSVLSTFKYQLITIAAAETFDVAANNLYTELSKAGGLIAKFLACCPTNYNLAEVWIQKIFPARYRKLVYANGGAGTFIGAATTANLAATISRFGVLGKKSNKGSLHVPYLNSDATMTGGRISTGMLTVTSTLGSFLLNTLVPIADTYVWQPGLFPAKATNIGQWAQVVASTPQQTVRTMRRRTVGVGK